MDEKKTSFNNSINDLPLYERPGRLDPNRHVPIERKERVDVNVHYARNSNGYYKDSDSTEFTGESANAMNPFEDSALLKGDVKPKSTGVKTGAAKIESKVFVPEIDTSAVRAKVKKQIVNEPEQPIYIADEDRAASSDYVADAMSGIETAEEKDSATVEVEISKLKRNVLLLGVFVVLEVAALTLMIVF